MIALQLLIMAWPTYIWTHVALSWVRLVWDAPAYHLEDRT